MPELTFIIHKPGVTKSDFGGATRLAGTAGTVCVAVTRPRVSIEGSTIGTDVCVRKLAKSNRITPPATGDIPAVTIGFGPVIPGMNVFQEVSGLAPSVFYVYLRHVRSCMPRPCISLAMLEMYVSKFRLNRS